MNQPPPGHPPHHPGQYASYPPPQPPKKGLGAGAIVAITLGSIVGAIVLLGIIGALVSDSSTGKKDVTAVRSSKPDAKPSEQPAPAKPAETPVQVTAKTAKFSPSVLHDGGAYTSVLVTVTNRGAEPIDINPLYFTITDTSGSKHTAELGVEERQIATVDLAPGENITGAITGKGKFTPAYVTYTDGLMGDGVRGDVS